MISLCGAINWVCPINWTHPLNRGLVNHFMSVPGITGTTAPIIDLCNAQQTARYGTLLGALNTGMLRPGGYGSVFFDGTDDYIEVPYTDDTPYLGALTIMCWAKLRISSHIHYFIGKHETDPAVDCPFRFGTSGAATGTLFILRSNASLNRSWPTASNAAGAYKVGSWGHYCYTSPEEIQSVPTFYIDGRIAPIGSASGSGTGLATGTSQPIRMGADHTAARTADGFVDDWRVYKRMLSAAEVRQVMIESLLGYPNLLNHIRFNLGNSTGSIQEGSLSAIIGLNSYLRAQLLARSASLQSTNVSSIFSGHMLANSYADANISTDKVFSGRLLANSSVVGTIRLGGTEDGHLIADGNVSSKINISSTQAGRIIANSNVNNIIIINPYVTGTSVLGAETGELHGLININSQLSGRKIAAGNVNNTIIFNSYQSGTVTTAAQTGVVNGNIIIGSIINGNLLSHGQLSEAIRSSAIEGGHLIANSNVISNIGINKNISGLRTVLGNVENKIVLNNVLAGKVLSAGNINSFINTAFIVNGRYIVGGQVSGNIVCVFLPNGEVIEFVDTSVNYAVEFVLNYLSSIDFDLNYADIKSYTL